jgi:hypothetical protein
VLSELWPDQALENVTYNDTNTVHVQCIQGEGGWGDRGTRSRKAAKCQAGKFGGDIQYNRLKVPVRRDWFGRKASKPSGLSKCQRNRDNDDGLDRPIRI